MSSGRSLLRNPVYNQRTRTMRTRKRMLAMVAVTMAAVAGCSSNPTRQEIGTVTGAVVGGIVGSALTGGSTVGTVGGAAAGAVAGNKIGKELDHPR